MLEFRAILAPTDFSEHSVAGLRLAAGLAERFGARLHLLHVLPDVVPAGPDVMVAPALPPEYYRETEAESLSALGKVLRAEWGKVEHPKTAVRWGDMVDGIVDYATQSGIDLVVVATHGRVGLSHALLGSAAERIVREAPCPVLIVPDRNR